ncbi:MAG: Nramp family divalent metal transporter [Candidatus Uhrbacteria bacterium]|nr:Nramp family divalent metal transporter [Candidatus Uhrbacteria bacterium]
MSSTTSQTKEFPKPIPFRKLIGPSFVILALGLGSGEVILWPYLASNYGLGIAWGALLGITFQYFINMEIERYALVRGESVFVGIAKFWKFAPQWFILSTFVGFGLPGIIAASAHVFASVVGIEQFEWVAMGFLLLIGFILSSGRTVYGLMEKLTRSIILIGVPLIFLLTIVLASKTDWLALFVGMAGQGESYAFFPEGLALATFLAAFAYSGAGGNLNLTQSIYVKEKGYGMGKYAMKLSGLFRKKGVREEITLEGTAFEDTPVAQRRFRVWWRRISLEHAIVFWFIGAVSILLLMLLAYATAFELNGNGQGIQFVLKEGLAIGQALGPAFGIGFLIIVTVMLFQTQLGVMDSTSRIMAENAAISIMKAKGTSAVPLSKIYFVFLWGQIVFGILLFAMGMSEPKFLLVLGACLNAVAMFVHIGLVSWLNFRSLPKFYQPSVLRRILLGGIFLFFGIFSSIVVIDQLF